MQKRFLILLLTILIGCAASAVFADVLPERGAASTTMATRWEEAFVTGNGRMGAMFFGNSQDETLIANHCRLFLPLGSHEIVPDLAVRIIVDGGQARVVEDHIHIKRADQILMLMRIVPWKTPLSREESEAWAYSPENPDFKQRAGKFEPVPDLGESSVVPYRPTHVWLPGISHQCTGLEYRLATPLGKMARHLLDRWMRLVITFLL